MTSALRAKAMKFLSGKSTRHQPRPEFWIDERNCRVCYDCDQGFTLFVRKHHCRVCGRVFCNRCSSHTIIASRNEPDAEPVRVGRCKLTLA